MQPYKITHITLITYSGKRVVLDAETEFITEPVRKVKDRILDSFVKKCKDSKDPFVGIELKTTSLFSQ